MFSKQEAAALRQEFWTSLGRYLSPIPSAEGLKVNWINYRTGVKDIAFRMNAGNKEAYIAIELSHKDAGVQELVFAQFEVFKKVLHNTLNESWEWQLQVYDDQGRRISRIFTTLENVSVFKPEDRPRLIAFFKQRILALDEFWSLAKPVFADLQ